MAFRFVSRSLASNSSLASRSSTSIFTAPSPHICARPSLSVFSLLRPLSAAVLPSSQAAAGLRPFSTRQTSSSLNDPSPNWSNRPPKETILLDGCDFEHWLCVMEPPEGDPTRDEIIDSFIKTLAMVVGSEEEARKKIYSVSTRCYFAFGALVSEEVSLKIKELPKVRWVLPDSYLDVRNKDYGGEPFIDGQAVPYDPKYHEEWIRNNSRANERNRRNDRPRNLDRSRNFERRQQNVQTQGNTPPMHNQNSNFAPPAQNNARPMQNHMAPPQSQAQNSYAPPMQNQNRNIVPPTQNMQRMPNNHMGPPLNNPIPPHNSMPPPQMPNNNMPPPQMMPNNNMPPPQMANNNMRAPHMQYNHTPPPHLQNMSNPMPPQGQQLQQNIPPVPNTSPNSGWSNNLAGSGSNIQNNAGWPVSGRE